MSGLVFASALSVALCVIDLLFFGFGALLRLFRAVV